MLKLESLSKAFSSIRMLNVEDKKLMEFLMIIVNLKRNNMNHKEIFDNFKMYAPLPLFVPFKKKF